MKTDIDPLTLPNLPLGERKIWDWLILLAKLLPKQRFYN